MGLVVACMHVGSSAGRILLLSGVHRQLPVNIRKLECRFNANRILPLHFMLNFPWLFAVLGCDPVHPRATAACHSAQELQP